METAALAGNGFEAGAVLPELEQEYEALRAVLAELLEPGPADASSRALPA
jgi:hypothetical protein